MDYGVREISEGDRLVEGGYLNRHVGMSKGLVEWEDTPCLGIGREERGRDGIDVPAVFDLTL